MDKEKNILLDIDHLTVNYELEDETVEAVRDVSFKVEKGKTLGLVGETGAGKTTTALAILNLIPDPPGVIKGGKIMLDGENVLEKSMKEMTHIRGKEVSMIFQDPMTSLNPVFTVGDQIAEALMIHENLDKGAAFKKAQEMLEIVGIPGERAHEYPHQFSGGMKQRVVIAIALACNPQLLIADEPTTALDVTIQAQVLDLMKELKKKYGMAMILITHDLGIIAETCDDVAVMYAGQIIERGSLEEIFNTARHPYTEGLFNSLPNIADRKERLKPIPGLMPDPTKLPKGCAFAPRCPYAKDSCIDKMPEEIHFGGTHYCRCSGYEDPGFRIEREDIQL
ncbi:MAG: ABC transporter ATP-binding protein [Spirochaetales bacterium]|jgi:peptide/nickel transport system ATP-binding protein|nr:ABC transporter ATP-binding protein [Spirochaetales bacterium]MBQ3697447.1 ABC transporter ATP-binding protein [Spirochaetales bacterium]MBQ3728286.1 ABC transporter ATP-binding protein [Spirochaetales bacterium]MBQ4281887.1 ABC transporter ATP-binding protein [Spirochaetales bacterium]MBQ4501600.1 ABC transporter ATP-binding protein [Spirochaetales bacterium]